jgi:hypothetical protein
MSPAPGLRVERHSDLVDGLGGDLRLEPKQIFARLVEALRPHCCVRQRMIEVDGDAEARVAALSARDTAQASGSAASHT